MLDYYAEYLREWKNISGKMDRHSYWSGLLTILVILAMLLWFANKIPTLKILPIVFAAAMLVPYLTATIRRLHDVGRGTAFILLMLLPVIGWICIFVEVIQNTKDEEDEKLIKRNKSNKIPEVRLPMRF